MFPATSSKAGSCVQGQNQALGPSGGGLMWAACLVRRQMLKAAGRTRLSLIMLTHPVLRSL